MADDQDDSFTAALAQVLRPLARAMIGQSVTIAQATELLKQAYVSAALQAEQSTPTDSRISLLTGIHRKDVKRLRENDPRPPRRPMLNASALALAVWSSDPQFADHEGRAIALPREGDPGFDQLAKKARIDLPTSTLLTALIEQGFVVRSSEDGLYRLTQTHLSQTNDTAAQRMAFEKNVSAHLKAVADNLSSDTPKHFERGAHFNQLSQASIARLEAEARTRLQQVLIDLNALALELQNEDDKADPPHEGRFQMGAYVYGQSPKVGDPKDD